MRHWPTPNSFRYDPKMHHERPLESANEPAYEMFPSFPSAVYCCTPLNSCWLYHKRRLKGSFLRVLPSLNVSFPRTRGVLPLYSGGSAMHFTCLLMSLSHFNDIYDTTQKRSTRPPKLKCTASPAAVYPAAARALPASPAAPRPARCGGPRRASRTTTRAPQSPAWQP